MQADALKQLQAVMLQNRVGKSIPPDVRGEIPPEVLLNLLMPDKMSSKDFLDHLFSMEGIGKPAPDDYNAYPEESLDMELEQTPDVMGINRQLGSVI